MAVMESRSSWAPQANSQPPPPIAHAPKPIGVMNRSEFPSRFVFMVSPSLLPKFLVETLPGGNDPSRLLMNAGAVPNDGHCRPTCAAPRHALLRGFRQIGDSPLFLRNP